MKWWDVVINALKDGFRAARVSAWFLLPLAGIFGVFRWVFQEYAPSRAKDLLGYLLEKVPGVTISPASVAVAWDRINQWVPVNEIVTYSIYFITLCSAVVIIKWVKKLLPMG